MTYLGKYQLLDLLGHGGMAEVYRGQLVGAEGFTRPVAIKYVLPSGAQTEAFAAMFVAEARATARMRHANVVSVLDFDRDPEGRFYMVLELVDGPPDLAQILKTGVPPISVIIYVMTEVLRGLGYAHDLPPGPDGVRGMVHRDISPHNILCSWDGDLKVSDWGISKLRAATQAEGSVAVKGKPSYMAPEQINAQPLDGRTDLWAVGVMLYEALIGQSPFTTPEMAATMWKVLSYHPPPPNRLRPEVPEDISAITIRLLQKAPEMRYPRASDVIADLLACRDAPRDGRGELVRLLAERFPERARPSGVYAAVAYGTPSGGFASGTPGYVPSSPPLPMSAMPATAPTSLERPAPAAPIPRPPLAPTVTAPPVSASPVPRARRWPVAVVAAGLGATAIAIGIAVLADGTPPRDVAATDTTAAPRVAVDAVDAGAVDAAPMAAAPSAANVISTAPASAPRSDAKTGPSHTRPDAGTSRSRRGRTPTPPSEERGFIKIPTEAK